MGSWSCLWLFGSRQLCRRICGVDEMTDIKKVTEGMPLDWLLAKDGTITQDELNAAAKTVNYNNRDLMPEPYLHFSDLYHELTGQELTKRVLQDWMMTFEY